ncbi:AMP-binding protein [Gimesia sp.]|uniref:AMP-binding protein n=1 Tax=Gimesia sp. TaxID=2024833 RepID=UPI000C55F735|nr:AMP-binding protein [Gimesia sp.]MAX37245.1 AMP-dependent synthetase [Gimesia sp.]HAH45336.1 AMP-dependent synthetase [Planctomycetaceae bacterium]
MEIPTATLIDCGLPADKANQLVDLLRQIPVQSDEELWRFLTTEVLTPEIPFGVHQLLYQRVFAERITNGKPAPAWFPGERELQQSHLAEWRGDLNLADFDAVYDWSISNRNDFTSKLIDSLGIQFREPPQQIMDYSAGVEEVEWLRGATLNIVESCLREKSDETAILFQRHLEEVQSLSYRELRELTAQVANGLSEAGIEPGERVAVMLPMTPESVAIFLGIIAAGCVVVTIADSFSAEEMQVRLKITNPRLIFIQDVISRNGRQLPLFAKLEILPELAAVVLPESESLAVSLREHDQLWSDFLSADSELTCVPRQTDAETTILFSSGTTGSPKGIPWDQTTPIKSAGDGYLHHDIHAGDVVCWPTNLGWMMGPWLVYASLINDATIALSDSVPTSRRFCEFVQNANVTMLGLVPSIVSAWRSQDATAGLDWSQIKVFSSTGECSNPEDMFWLMSRAGYRPVIEYCGGTETGGGYITGTVLKPGVPGLFSCPALGFEWLLLNEAGEETKNGEVFFVPPVIGLSTRLINRNHHDVYFADITPGPQGQTLRRHGDQIEALPGGYFRAHGRVDDAMNLGGIKVSCVQIEELLTQSTGVREVAAIAVAPPGGGPGQLVIFVVMQNRDSFIAADLMQEMQQMIRSQLNPLFKIHAVREIEQLPRTASNKVMRRKLRDLYQSEEL